MKRWEVRTVMISIPIPTGTLPGVNLDWEPFAVTHVSGSDGFYIVWLRRAVDVESQ
mgnify:CR=1 FL=1